MIFCNAETCTCCSLVEGSANCLRKQALKCVYLSKKTLGRGVHEALEELSLQLMDEASYREKELIIPPVGAN